MLVILKAEGSGCWLLLQFLGSCTFRGSLGIIMELCTCGDLKSALASGEVVWGPKCVLAPRASHRQQMS